MRKTSILFIVILFSFILSLTGCSKDQVDYKDVVHPDSGKTYYDIFNNYIFIDKVEWVIEDKELIAYMNFDVSKVFPDYVIFIHDLNYKASFVIDLKDYNVKMIIIEMFYSGNLTMKQNITNIATIRESMNNILGDQLFLKKYLTR